MNFPKFQDLVEKRTGFRTMENPMGTGEYFSDSCGDMYTYYVKVGPGDVIEDISYFTTGCGFGTATCSLLVDLALGKTLDQAYAIDDAQIEAELQKMPQVADCAVFGIPDEDYGEAICAVVQPQPGALISEQDVKTYLRQHMAGYKVPKRVDFAADLPREDSGKIFKRKLRAPFWEGQGRSI